MLRVVGLAACSVLVSLCPQNGRAQGVPISTVVDPADCRPVDGGELYSQHLDGAYDDWLVETETKEGPLLGFSPYSFDGGTYQVDAWSFTRNVMLDATIVVYVTYPDGRLHVESDDLTGFFFGSAHVQQVGDTPPPSRSSSAPSVETILPDDLGSWRAGVEEGPATFPRLNGRWPEIAFAPVRELDIESTGSCATGGLTDDQRGGGGLLAGYNVYRVESEERPELEELARQENWHDYFSYPPSPDDQARLHDPDGWVSTGDEVLVYLDGNRAQDGSPRSHGAPPVMEPGRRYWYAIQPVARGAVEDFAWVSLAGQDPADYRTDRDGDGIPDAVDMDGPGSANGPEFVSPQAERGEWGLGLTSQGRALLSKRMAVDMDELGVTPRTDVVTEPLQLRVIGDLLVWGGGPLGTQSWKLMRASRPDELSLGKSRPDADTWTVTGRVFADSERPAGDRSLLCYRVLAAP